MVKARESMRKIREEDLKHTAMARGDIRAYCLDCRRKVTPRGANVWGFFALVLIGLMLVPFFIGMIILLFAFLYYLKHYKSGGRCPICNGRNLKYDI